MEHALPHFTPGGLGFAFGLTLMAGLATGLGRAVALHNIPEGVSVSVPIFYATGSRGRGGLGWVVERPMDPVAPGWRPYEECFQGWRADRS
jgi:ZIP family zinc transporter